jgi:hypothetical protein
MGGAVLRGKIFESPNGNEVNKYKGAKDQLGTDAHPCANMWSRMRWLKRLEVSRSHDLLNKTTRIKQNNKNIAPEMCHEKWILSKLIRTHNPKA